jgi:hypothetical protein
MKSTAGVSIREQGLFHPEGEQGLFQPMGEQDLSQPMENKGLSAIVRIRTNNFSQHYLYYLPPKSDQNVTFLKPFFTCLSFTYIYKNPS